MIEIEKFIDRFGDDVYALALVCTKDFESASRIFTDIISEYEDLPDSMEMPDLATRVCSVCKTAKFSESAETFSQLGLSKKQESLLGGFFSQPFITRAAVHLYFENDLTVEQIAEALGETPRHISALLNGLQTELFDKLEDDYKELCVKLAAPDELKENAIIAAKSGELRMFEIRDDPIPKHTWTKKQMIATVIVAVIVTITLMFVIPILNKLMDDYFTGSSYDEAPSDLIFPYTSKVDPIE